MMRSHVLISSHKGVGATTSWKVTIGSHQAWWHDPRQGWGLTCFVRFVSAGHGKPKDRRSEMRKTSTELWKLGSAERHNAMHKVEKSGKKWKRDYAVEISCLRNSQIVPFTGWLQSAYSQGFPRFAMLICASNSLGVFRKTMPFDVLARSQRAGSETWTTGGSRGVQEINSLGPIPTVMESNMINVTAFFDVFPESSGIQTTHENLEHQTHQT
jgi:hypothetical protein